MKIKHGSALAFAVGALALGCGDHATSGAIVPSGGAGAGGTSGGAPGGGAGGMNAAGGSAGSSLAGTGGSIGSGGTTGAAGSAGSGVAGAVACPSTGTQSDPDTAGDGTSQLDAPYTPAPETLSHLNNAPKGKLNGVEVGMPTAPLVYAGKTLYPGVSQMLKYEYWIYVPAQYEPGCAAALAVFQDGLHFVGIDDAKLNTPTVLDNLIASGDIPVTIALFINPGEPGTGHYDGQEYQNRHVQYDKNDDTYVSFLVNEFLPANVLAQYDIVTDPDGWEIGGHSSGGIAAFMAGWYRPDKFRKLLTFDASFPNTTPNSGVALLDDINQSAVKPLRTYLMSGPNDLGGWYPANTQ
ncbi:MAG TPA: alpha/beta hydrolase-fold protein, partial [Polyangiaceae bacterium]|nr:alpha/beta hydrolase-fold protein [Polyangiaceae bacterium]